MKSLGVLFRSLTHKTLVLFLAISILATNVHAACNGDVNDNQLLDIGDALFTLKYVVKLIDNEANKAQYLATADVSPLDTNQMPKGDGQIDISDALLILKRVVNLLGWDVTPPGQPGAPVKIALDSAGTVQSAITATSLGGSQLTLHAGTRIALIGDGGSISTPASLDNVYLTLADDSGPLPPLPAGITPLAQLRVALTIDGVERDAFFWPAAGDGTSGRRLKLSVVTDQALSDGTLGLLFYLSSGNLVKVGSSTITKVGGASSGVVTLSRRASIAPLAEGSDSNQMDFDLGQTGSYNSGGSSQGSGSPPVGAFWSEFTVPDPGPVDLGGGVVVDDPSRVNSVMIIEDSTTEILGDCVFGASDTAATGPSGSDGSQFWCSRNGNTIKISSPQSNLPKIHATRVSTVNPNLVMWNISNIPPNGGLNGPDGTVYPDPYIKKEFQFAGVKKLTFTTKANKEYDWMRENALKPLQDAGYKVFQNSFEKTNPGFIALLSVHDTLDARVLMEENVITKDGIWEVRSGDATRGNRGTYDYTQKYRGTAKAYLTHPAFPAVKFWKIDANVTFKRDPDKSSEETTAYNTSGGTITQTVYTFPFSSAGSPCHGIPASFTDTYDIFPGDGVLYISAGADPVMYGAGASISASTPVVSHSYQFCCPGVPCEPMTMERTAQEHQWLNTGPEKKQAQSGGTLIDNFKDDTGSFEWILAPVDNNQ